MTKHAVDAIDKLPRDRVVDNRVYHDPEVYRLEIEKVFRQIWLFACHESELTQTGDYLATEIAGEPLVLTRDGEGQLRAYVNACRHRGSLIVTDEAGHCNSFRCPYHFWVYSLNGDLTGVPFEQAYDGTGFEKREFSLLEVACDSVLGLVFVSFADDPEPLAHWLGSELIDTLSTPLGHADFAVWDRSRTDDFAANWKIFAENARDGYHVPFVHPFLRKASPPKEYQLYENGHAVQHLGVDWDGFEGYDLDLVRSAPFPGIDPGFGYIVTIFPDVTIMLRWNMISIDSQQLLGPTSLRFENRTLGLRDDDEELKQVRLYNQKMWFGNPVELEDRPIFLAQQRGLQSRELRHSIIARGQDATTGYRGDDNRLRQFWVMWRELMGTQENSIEPSSVR